MGMPSILRIGAYINDGKIGEITHKLYDTITGIQWGKLPDDMGWTTGLD